MPFSPCCSALKSPIHEVGFLTDTTKLVFPLDGGTLQRDCHTEGCSSLICGLLYLRVHRKGAETCTRGRGGRNMHSSDEGSYVQALLEVDSGWRWSAKRRTTGRSWTCRDGRPILTFPSASLHIMDRLHFRRGCGRAPAQGTALVACASNPNSYSTSTTTKLHDGVHEPIPPRANGDGTI